MIRIRPGASWKQDAEVRRALARAPAEAATLVVDALAIEVDGIDLAAGRAEGELLPAVEALVSAVARLVEGASRASVHFSDGGVEVLLRRRGAAALITVVALERPSRVLARDVSVDLDALAAAARQAGEELVRDVALLAPASRAEVGGGLRAAVARLAAARTRAPEESAPVSPAPVQSPRRKRRHAPTCGFELHDAEGLLASYRGPGADLGSLLAPGRVHVRTPRGDEIFSLECSPFLALRDLAALAGRIVGADAGAEPLVVQDLATSGRARSVSIAVDVGRGVVRFGDRAAVAVAPLLLARALLEAAIDFCGVAAARNPWQSANPWISELRTSASERVALIDELVAGDQPSSRPLPSRVPARTGLPRAPLGPGRTRRIVFRRGWRTDVGAPAGAGLFVRADLLVAAGSAAVAALDLASGAERWRAAGAEWAFVASGRVFAVAAGGLSCADLTSGARRWACVLDEHEGPPRAAFTLRDGPLVLAWPRSLAAFDVASGVRLWTFTAPAGPALHAAGSGPLTIVATDTGLAYGVDGGGRIAWRVRLPGPAAGPARLIPEGALLPAMTALGGTLVLVEPTTGARRWDAALDFVPTAVVPFAGLLAASGTIGGDPVIAALDPANGRPLWTESSPVQGGALALASLSSALLAKNAAGGCSAISRDGAVLWSQRREAPHPPPVNLAPVPARGLVLVPSESVVVLDPGAGAALGTARCGAPVRLHVGADLGLVAMDAEGLVSAWRVATHLGVVPSGRRPER